MATLQSHPICERASVLETKAFSYDQFFLKVRAELYQGIGIFKGRRGVRGITLQACQRPPLLCWQRRSRRNTGRAVIGKNERNA